MPLWFRRSPLAKCRACSGTPPDRGRGQGPVTRMLCWFPGPSVVTGAILGKRQPGRRVELALSGLFCSLLGLCCVCQTAFEDPFEEDGCLCVFVGLIFPVVACQLCFAGASGWRGGTILREGLSCHSCFACLYTWQAASEDFSFKKEDRLLCIDCPCGSIASMVGERAGQLQGKPWLMFVLLVHLRALFAVWPGVRGPCLR